jgi:CheY-like chemotaxis protein
MKNKKTVFLIEDDEEDQQFFKDALLHLDHLSLFAIAKNGREALEILEHSSVLPDIIFMDINMPLMNGIDCLIELRRRNRVKNVPVVMLSSDISRKADVCKLGARGFIKKDFENHRLSRQIQEMVNINIANGFHIRKQEFNQPNFLISQCFKLETSHHVNI